MSKSAAEAAVLMINTARVEELEEVLQLLEQLRAQRSELCGVSQRHLYGSASASPFRCECEHYGQTDPPQQGLHRPVSA